MSIEIFGLKDDDVKNHFSDKMPQEPEMTDKQPLHIALPLFISGWRYSAYMDQNEYGPLWLFIGIRHAKIVGFTYVRSPDRVNAVVNPVTTRAAVKKKSKDFVNIKIHRDLIPTWEAFCLEQQAHHKEQAKLFSAQLKK